MQDFIVLLAAVALGALSWEMCVVSDWLLGKKAPTRPKKSESIANHHTAQPIDCVYQVAPGAIAKRTTKMKKIEAIFRQLKLEEVKNALIDQGIEGMTLTEVHGHGADKGRTMTYRGSERQLDMVPRVKLETVVADDVVERVLDTVFQIAHTGEVGDGRIFVTNIECALRIRTGEFSGEEGFATAASANWADQVGGRHSASGMPSHF